MDKLIKLALFLLIACQDISAQSVNGNAKIDIADDSSGLGELSWANTNGWHNYLKGSAIGNFDLNCKDQAGNFSFKSGQSRATLLTHNAGTIQLMYRLPGKLDLLQEFKTTGTKVTWDLTVVNKSKGTIEILDFSVPVPVAKFDKKIPVQENLIEHKFIGGNASFCYWVPYSGVGDILLMTMKDKTSLEYFSGMEQDSLRIFFHASTAIDRTNDTWRLPGSSAQIGAGKRINYGFKFQLVHSLEEVRNALFDEGCPDMRVAPGMTVPNDLSVNCLVRVKGGIKKLLAEYPGETSIKYIGQKSQNYSLYQINFRKNGENMISVFYGDNKKGYFNFFSTEPIETLIKKRSDFIASKQQIRDTSKWYDGLYSIWDMEQAKLLSPDDKGPLPDFVVGGSDDPSNCKPLFVSEKNVVFPDQQEIKGLEYYEQNFVWGGLQRRDDEYPYPYGIYGSENWYENRFGKVAGYNSGGWGKERMWRTFDYTTHLAIYFNLYKIARDYPAMVSYLDAKGYLERAYQTAMAFFTVPYNIEMGPKWSFHGWTDWAYKQGNFHERYIVELIEELKMNRQDEKAETLKREWEKKVKYFIYDDPWPFGSEFEVDRTAFESSYYVAAYAKQHILKPQEQLWYDKNRKIWYSHLNISDSANNVFMEKQLRANLALRGTIEPEFNSLGTAWSNTYGLDYMSQMGGVAILDYALDFSKEPARYINIGYNSLLSSWALMNTGNGNNGFGYWYPNKKNDGAVGWVFTPAQHATTYFRNIPAKRGIWKYDGEIDHGLTGAVHGSSSVVVRDSLFGTIGYGCEITADDKTDISVIPRDGVQRKIAFLLNQKPVCIELYQDGFAKDSVIRYSKAADGISFSIGNRQQLSNNCNLSIKNFKTGRYDVYANNKKYHTFSISKIGEIIQLNVPVMNANVKLNITKQ